MAYTDDLGNIGLLMVKYLRQEISEEEGVELGKWVDASPGNKAKFEEWINDQRLIKKMNQWEQAGMNGDAVWGKIEKILNPPVPLVKIIFIKRHWLKFAAAIILLIGISFWDRVKMKPNEVSQTNIKKVLPSDITPGGYKARLILADGAVIVLDSAATGKLAQQGGTVILNRNGQLVYTGSGASSFGKDEERYNTLTTSKGEIYSLTLSDGSKVWLNSASSIHYPVTFVGNERKVEITGEVYFEITHNAAKPFKVYVPSTGNRPGMETEVLGTKFNINAYNDDTAIKTTLLEGKVKIGSEQRTPANNHNGNIQSVILKPGQQAQFYSSSSGNTGKAIKVVNDADTEEVLAWKNGQFVFDGADLQQVMRQIERWYDVDVVFENNTKTPSIHFDGQISRYSNASRVLEMLAATGSVDFKIEGRKVTVMTKLNK